MKKGDWEFVADLAVTVLSKLQKLLPGLVQHGVAAVQERQGA